ncbi:MAG: Crp/Fnr family transcriptional regulator [Alphaproteobacteria bacterium]|nr:Crp/Fnr family transcriptional regulator [Alphaproteobacteria bacterium]
MVQTSHKLKFLAELDGEQKKRFEDHATARNASKGEEIIGHGRDGASNRADRFVFFIVDGQFRALILSPTGRQVPYRDLGPGDHFGELAALDSGPRTASVIALTPGKLLQLDGVHFEQLLSSSPKAALWLARGFASQIRDLTKRVFNLTALNVADRIRSELLRLGLEASVENNSARIRRMPIHEDLASLLGTQREAVTRELGELEKSGLISRKGRELVILDFDELTRRVQRGGGENFGLAPLNGREAGKRRNKPKS